jgi:methylthioribose-1-phosphate isomerase
VTDPLPPPLRWIGGLDGHLELLDRHLTTPETIIDALRTGSITNPSAIPLAAAYALVLAARQIPTTSQAAILLTHLQSTAALLKSTVPDTPALATTLDHLLRIADRERAIGVRPLQLRLFHEAQRLAHPATN